MFRVGLGAAVSASSSDLQSPVDAILSILGVRMTAGQIVIHLADGGKVQKVETNLVHRPGGKP